MQDEDKDFGKYGLSSARYNEFKRRNLLKKCLSPEDGTCGTPEGILASLLKSYNVDDLMNKKDPEHKKGKELFLCCLFAFILKHIIKNELAICIPIKDNGIDIYVREIDDENKQIILHPIQVCEYPERFDKEKNEDFTLKILNFIKEKKFKYAKSNDDLLLWIEPEANTTLQLTMLRNLFQKEKIIPFSQIVLIGRNNDKINICCLYSKDKKYYFSFSYNWKHNTIETIKQ